MTVFRRVVASVAFSISTTLVLMYAVSRFPGMYIPLPYWIFGFFCPGIISLIVSLLLVRQTERIRELQREREEFLELLSHDMRAPQASIIALLQDGATQWNPELTERVRTYASRTLKLADDMVHLSRAQMVNYKFEELDLIAIGYDAIDALTPQARAKRITIRPSVSDEEIFVRGEPSLLARALINLLDNAVKFSREASTVRVEMSRLLQNKREWVVCSVSDEGIGIPPEQLPRLYNRFEAARAGSAGSAGGSGLGLAFVRTVITRHGGSIACDSWPGRGTTFQIRLPTAT